MFFNLLNNRFSDPWGSESYPGIWKNMDILGGVTSKYAKSPVNVYSNDEEVIVSIFAPGVLLENIDIGIEEKVLSVGVKSGKQEFEGFEVLRSEISDKNFTRKLELPFEVESEKVEAKYVNGVLTIQLPKSEKLKPKKVQIKVEN
ncbi:MAG: Hsp20/alpha crystallin family protein [Leptospiraceae bacterium]|nr:Hsp20/alpha crystallin family protein [Leptospiraceae bacterium]MCK6380554.1 Hsp20/alpha crystallin family protein [Leptospiraceae bacterium]NUM41805.1 Hsp20/alpha crystallin family protein [Leptospiraceae bacterium]